MSNVSIVEKKLLLKKKGDYLVLCWSDGTDIPGQTALELTQRSSEPTLAKLEFYVDGEVISLDDSCDKGHHVSHEDIEKAFRAIERCLAISFISIDGDGIIKLKVAGYELIGKL